MGFTNCDEYNVLIFLLMKMRENVYERPRRTERTTSSGVPKWTSLLQLTPPNQYGLNIVLASDSVFATVDILAYRWNAAFPQDLVEFHANTPFHCQIGENRGCSLKWICYNYHDGAKGYGSRDWSKTRRAVRLELYWYKDCASGRIRCSLSFQQR